MPYNMAYLSPQQRFAWGSSSDVSSFLAQEPHKSTKMLAAPRAAGNSARSSRQPAQLLRVGCAASPVPNHRKQACSRQLCRPVRAIELDFSDVDTQLSVAGLVLGLVFGLGAPYWYVSRAERDEERLEEIRAMNRATYQETGEYMSEDEIAKIRKPKWTDRREWQDDD